MPEQEHDKREPKKGKWGCGLLGVPLPEYVRREMLDLLMGGRHALVARTAHFGEDDREVQEAMRRVREENTLKAVLGSKIDMAAILKAPQELFVAEAEWKKLMELDLEPKPEPELGGKETMDAKLKLMDVDAPRIRRLTRCSPPPCRRVRLLWQSSPRRPPPCGGRRWSDALWLAWRRTWLHCRWAGRMTTMSACVK